MDLARLFTIQVEPGGVSVFFVRRLQLQQWLLLYQIQ
jgi:hypothetical protein